MGFDNIVVVDTTLREGEQFVSADFSTEDKLDLAHALCDFGIQFLELTSPAASKRSRSDAEKIASANLPAMIAAHIRCHVDDAAIALYTGVGALNMVMAISPILRAASHGRAIPEVVRIAAETAEFVRKRAPNVQLRKFGVGPLRCEGDRRAKNALIRGRRDTAGNVLRTAELRIHGGQIHRRIGPGITQERASTRCVDTGRRAVRGHATGQCNHSHKYDDHRFGPHFDISPVPTPTPSVST